MTSPRITQMDTDERHGTGRARTSAFAPACGIGELCTREGIRSKESGWKEPRVEETER